MSDLTTSTTLSTPWHRAIVDLLVNGAGDELTRNQLAATYLLSLRQLVGQAASPQPPWLFFINGGGTTPDPLCEVARWNQGDGSPGIEDQTSDKFRGSVAVMRDMAGRRKRLRDRGIAGVPKLEAREESGFRNYLVRAFGSGMIGHYSKRYDPVLGWVAGGGNDLLLWLDQPDDHDSFCHDLHTRSDKLMWPTGINSTMEMTDKFVSVTGSLNASRWDAGLVGDMLGAQLPVLYIPHVAEGPAICCDERALGCVAMILQGQLRSGMLHWMYPRCQPMSDEYAAGCEHILRARLAHCPPNYDFFIMLTLREVDAFCLRLCRMLAGFDCPVDELELLRRDLTRATIRAITLGVESMAYHGVGVATFRPREEVCQILEIIRVTNSITRRDLQRKHPALPAAERDRVLDHMAKEGLIHVDGQRVTAVPLATFISSLAERPGLTAPDVGCAHLPDKWACVKKG